jgi:immune inhibitor A
MRIMSHMRSGVTIFLIFSLMAVASGAWCHGLIPSPWEQGDSRAVLGPMHRLEVNAGARIEVPEELKAPPVSPYRAIVLLVDFVDNPADTLNHTPDAFRELYFGTSAGSICDYYDEVSYGQFELYGDVYGWYTMPFPYSYYVADLAGIGPYPKNSQKLTEDAVAAADHAVDFSLYDNDGDGEVDGLFILHAGAGREEIPSVPDDVMHSHKWDLSSGGNSPGPYLTEEGIDVDPYCIVPEEHPNGTIASIGVACHEFAHILGAPDLYVTKEDFPAVVGDFCLMDHGLWLGIPYGSSPVHPCSWIKSLFGWVEPEVVDGREIDKASLPAVEFDPVVYQLTDNPGGVDWSASHPGTGEYFLVSNRQPHDESYDWKLPGGGLLILHIDESQWDNNDPERRLVQVVQADGDFSTATEGEASDLWQSSEEGFSPHSQPSSDFYDGTPSDASVTFISDSDSVMTAHIRVGVIEVDKPYSYPNPYVKESSGDEATIVYLPSGERGERGAPSLKVTLFTLSGDKVRTLDEELTEVDPAFGKAVWDGRNDDGQEVASGIYFYIIETESEKKVGRLTFVH